MHRRTLNRTRYYILRSFVTNKTRRDDPPGDHSAHERLIAVNLCLSVDEFLPISKVSIHKHEAKLGAPNPRDLLKSWSLEPIRAVHCVEDPILLSQVFGMSTLWGREAVTTSAAYGSIVDEKALHHKSWQMCETYTHTPSTSTIPYHGILYCIAASLLVGDGMEKILRHFECQSCSSHGMDTVTT